MKYWIYTAFDAKMETHEGVVTGHTLEDVALKLRQHGLQLLCLTSTTARNYNTHLKRCKQIKSLQNTQSLMSDESIMPSIYPSQSHANLSQCLLIFVAILLLGLVCYLYI